MLSTLPYITPMAQKKSATTAKKKAKGKVLVTGAAGFIGSHVVDSLIALGYEVVAVDDLSGGFKDNVPAGARFIKGDVSNVTFVKDLFKKHSFDYVFHLAAYAAEGLSHFIRNFNYTNNLIGSANLINGAVNQGVKCFVFTSSIAVYGRNQLPMREDLVPQPEDPYGVAKYAVELDLKAAHEMFGMNYIIFRPHNVYGERQNIGDRYRNVLGIFMNQIMQKKSMTIFGDGTQKRAFTHVSDVAPVIASSIENKKAYNHSFNIGADTPYTVLELAETIAESFGVKKDIAFLPERNEVKEAYADHAKVKDFFGHEPRVTLKDGVVRMSAWAKIAGPRQSKRFKGIEVEKNLPPSWR